MRDTNPEQSRRCWSEAVRLLAGYDDPRAVRVRRRIEGELSGPG